MFEHTAREGLADEALIPKRDHGSKACLRSSKDRVHRQLNKS